MTKSSFCYLALATGLMVILTLGCSRNDNQEPAELAASPQELAELLANAPEVEVPPDAEPPPNSFPPGTSGTGEGARQFVGQVAGTEIFIGLYLDHSQVMAYVCDGIPPDTPWTVKEWFSGALVDGRFELTSGGGLGLSGTATNGLVSGTLTLPDDQELAYSAELAGAGAGLRREVIETDSGLVADGWITLPDGRVRGVATVTSGGITCVCSSTYRYCRNCNNCSWYYTGQRC